MSIVAGQLVRSRVRKKGGLTWAPEDGSYRITWIVLRYREVGQPTYRRRGGSGAIRVGVECRREAGYAMQVGSLHEQPGQTENMRCR